jgi:heterotetrameric sarcosine oxidase delta subunit
LSFELPCPHCGTRPAPEFAFGGALGQDAAPATLDALSEQLYFSDNVAGEQLELWFHRFGCERWLVARRDTRTNAVSATWDGVWPEGESAPP